MTTQTMKRIHERILDQVREYKQKENELKQLFENMSNAYGLDVVNALFTETSSHLHPTPHKDTAIIHMPAPSVSKLSNSAPALRNELSKTSNKTPIVVTHLRRKKRLSFAVPGAFTALKPDVLAVLQAMPKNTDFTSQDVKNKLKAQNIPFDPAHVTLIMSKKTSRGVKVINKKAKGFGKANTYRITGKVSLK